MTTRPCIICVAITGSLPRKANNPAAEQVEATQAAMEAGASIVHAHVRNEDESPSSDPEGFARLLEGLRTHCPDLIVQFSTGGRSGAGRERGGMLSLRPDMASLAGGALVCRRLSSKAGARRLAGLDCRSGRPKRLPSAARPRHPAQEQLRLVPPARGERLISRRPGSVAGVGLPLEATQPVRPVWAA